MKVYENISNKISLSLKISAKYSSLAEKYYFGYLQWTCINNKINENQTFTKSLNYQLFQCIMQEIDKINTTKISIFLI